MNDMVLSTHALGGATAALLFPHHPVIAFTAGFLSHFLLDAIPHWHYELRSLKKPSGNPMDYYFVSDKRLLRDFLMAASDAALGFLVLLPIMAFMPFDIGQAIFWGAVGGIMPDGLQVVYYAFRNSPIKYLQRFHKWIHARARLDDKPLVGVGAQLILIAIFFFLIVRFLV